MEAPKEDPLMPDSWFDDILKALVNISISLETKQQIMQRGGISLSKGYLGCFGVRGSFSPRFGVHDHLDMGRIF